MWSSTILLNPHIRVYNLRCLLVGAVLLVTLGAVINVYGWDDYQANSHLDAVPIATGCLMIVHHISALRMCSRRTAVLDLVLSIVEIICEVTIRDTAYCVDGGGNYLPGVYDPGISRPSLATKIRVSWRMPRCKSAVYGMENCAESLNAQILTRGEFIGILILRALIISAIMLALPVFTFYSIFWIPATAQVRTNIISGPGNLEFPEGNATVGFQFDYSLVGGFPSVTATDGVICPLRSVQDNEYTAVADCPKGWWISEPITIAIPFPFSTSGEPKNLRSTVYVFPGLGKTNIPVLPAMHLYAYMSWTSRQTISSPLLGPFSPQRIVYDMEVDTLLNSGSVDDPPGSSSSNLTLVLRSPFPTKFLQDTAATPLDGMSTVGGVWTMVNGTFLLFFGANFMYFAFGRRPLSALGIVHLFQRRTLTRRWHEDFPALQTEGGQAGSESAGIVAFIRERLVDIDSVEAEKQDIIGDAESHKLTAENSNTESQYTTSPTKSKDPEGEDLRYQLDEIPLMRLGSELGHWVGQNGSGIDSPDSLAVGTAPQLPKRLRGISKTTQLSLRSYVFGGRLSPSLSWVGILRLGWRRLRKSLSWTGILRLWPNVLRVGLIWTTIKDV
ncbi:hypothetical protein DFH06DRAFT_1140357 [Mycena polygramma]|nr:hypothetical protein DFH06DRAFT_1140357 [Mycena polygramma]